MSLIIKSNGDTSISDYIINDFKVPLSCGRNRNGTHIIGELTITVSGSCPEAHRAIDSAIEIYTYESTYPSFTGEIIDSQFNYNDRTYKLTIKDYLYKLNQKVISHSNLLTALNLGTGIEKGIDDYGHPSVQVLFIIEEMFIDCGITFFDINASSFADDDITTITFEGTSRVIEFEHLRLDQAMFFTINQDYAGGQSLQATAYVKNRITYWNFISDFLSHFDCHIYLSFNGTAKEYRIGKIQNIGSLFLHDDLIYSYKQRGIIATGQGWNVSHKYSDDRNLYGTGKQPTALTVNKKFSGGGGKEILTVKNNLVYFYNKWWTANNYNVIWGSSDDAGAYDDVHCYTANSMTDGQKKSTQLDLTILKREIPLAQKYIDFRLNTALIKKSGQTLEIVYES